MNENLPDKPRYDFAIVGEKIAAALMQAAEDQVTEAANLLESTKVLADGIRAQVEVQSKLLQDMNGRLRDFGESVLEAHSKYINGGKHENPSP
jgi:hypothetical protein